MLHEAGLDEASTRYVSAEASGLVLMFRDMVSADETGGARYLLETFDSIAARKIVVNAIGFNQVEPDGHVTKIDFDDDQNPSLHLSRSTAMVDLLYNNGADVSAMNRAGETADVAFLANDASMEAF